MEPSTSRPATEETSRADTYNQILKFNCDECKEPLEDYETAIIHFQMEHQTTGYAFCCDKKLNFGSRLDKHIAVHDTPDYIKGTPLNRQCGHCRMLFDTRPELKLHLEAEHKKDPLPATIPCPDCPKLFRTTSGLRTHTNHIHTNPKEGVTCRPCKIQWELDL